MLSGMEVPVIYEDENILAVNKPAGLVVHSDGRTKEETLTDWVLARYPAFTDIGGLHTLDSGRYVPRAGILHRLDRETSGVIVIVKNDETFNFLQRQFLYHSIEKVYNAFVIGTPDPSEGEIDTPIGRSRSDFRQWTVGEEARGTLRPASTRYRVLSVGGEYALLELTPKTGRTHQLRFGDRQRVGPRGRGRGLDRRRVADESLAWAWRSSFGCLDHRGGEPRQPRGDDAASFLHPLCDAAPALRPERTAPDGLRTKPARLPIGANHCRRPQLRLRLVA